jgi:hypothetical protein
MNHNFFNCFDIYNSNFIIFGLDNVFISVKLITYL